MQDEDEDEEDDDKGDLKWRRGIVQLLVNMMLKTGKRGANLYYGTSRRS